MIQHTKDRPLAELFSADNQITYYIPKYQREYVWTKWNWEPLFDDIEESISSHFLGSIICINSQTDTSLPANIELVDGQQRMTTISLLYLSIYKYLSENIPENNDDERLELLSLKKRILINSKKSLRLSPSMSNSNLNDYKYLFSEIFPELVAQKEKFLGLRQISRAFSYFNNRFNETENEQPKYNYDSVKSFLEKLNSAVIVKIDVANHSDAFTLFETLNNRGVPLSAIDLIKNKFLAKLESKHSNSNLDENFERWNQLIKNLTDDYNIQERFLRQFYNAFKVDPEIEVERINKALKSNLIRIYEELINKNPQKIFNRLEEASLIYSKHIQYENEENSDKLVKALRNLENVNGTDGYMLLMFVVKKFGINENEKIELINLLCNYFIRRNVTDSPPTRDLTNFFMDVIVETNKLEKYNFHEIKAIIIEKAKPAKDEVFREKLHGNLYEENVGATRYILSSIEAYLSETRERFNNFYLREKSIFVWTVEHILPQGENIPADWVEMIANGDKNAANEIRKSHVHKLGNLTLTGYNSQLSNTSLERKQNKADKDGKLIGFKNGLAINEAIKDISVWNQETIEKRTEWLVEKAMEVFDI